MESFTLSNAIETFHKLEKGILGIINTADIFTVHLIAKCRNSEADKDLINTLLTTNKISGHALLSESYTNDEIKVLEENGLLKGIGQQIVLATYTALEFYLIDKFKEYYRYTMNDKNIAFVENSLERFSFRSLNEIKKHYWELFSTHLPAFEVDYYSTDKSSFHPKDSWEAIRLMSDARNEIAHAGESATYKVITLMDAWYPFDFVRRWVDLFDANFDFLIYKGYETGPIKEYKKRLPKQEPKCRN